MFILCPLLKKTKTKKPYFHCFLIVLRLKYLDMTLALKMLYFLWSLPASRLISCSPSFSAQLPTMCSSLTLSVPLIWTFTFRISSAQNGNSVSTLYTPQALSLTLQLQLCSRFFGEPSLPVSCAAPLFHVQCFFLPFSTLHWTHAQQQIGMHGRDGLMDN